MPDTFLDIRNAVLSNTGRQDRVPYINRAINKALEVYGRAWPWKALRTVATVVINAGDLSVALPDDIGWVQQIQLINGVNSYSIEIKNKVFLLQKWPNPTASGSGFPAIGYLDGGLFYFAPKANTTYNLSVFYYKVLTPLVLDTDTIIVPNLDEAVVAYATAKTFASVEQFDSAQQWNQMAGIEFTTAKDADARNIGQVDTAQMTGGRGMVSANPQLDPFVFNNSSGNAGGGNGW